VPQALPAPVAVLASEWAPDLATVALPLRTVADELRAYELGATGPCSLRAVRFEDGTEWTAPPTPAPSASPGS
jgi:hypothetical protein